MKDLFNNGSAYLKESQYIVPNIIFLPKLSPNLLKFFEMILIIFNKVECQKQDVPNAVPAIMAGLCLTQNTKLAPNVAPSWKSARKIEPERRPIKLTILARVLFTPKDAGQTPSAFQSPC